MAKQKFIEKSDQGLAEFQQVNCRGCKFADKKKVGTGLACCQYGGRVEHKPRNFNDPLEGACLSRKERG